MPDRPETTRFDITETDIGRHVRRKSTGEIGVVSRDSGNGWLHPWIVYEWKDYLDDLEYVTVIPMVIDSRTPDALPLLRAQSAMIEEMRQALEEIKQATQRHTLLVGFAHYAPTVQELQERLDTIAAIVDRSLINGI